MQITQKISSLKSSQKHVSSDAAYIFCSKIFNLVDQNILKEYLRILEFYCETVKAIFKAFYTSIYFYSHKLTFAKREIIVVKSPIFTF